jgi:hypothetical protein
VLRREANVTSLHALTLELCGWFNAPAALTPELRKKKVLGGVDGADVLTFFCVLVLTGRSVNKYGITGRNRFCCIISPNK